MLSDEEKAKVVERIQIEEQIRQELRGPPKRERFAWLENKAVLLLAGFILTGVLVPLFQYTQETITWKRQNRYDNTKYRLTMMRDGTAQFVLLWAQTVQTCRQLQPFVEAPATLPPEKYEAFLSQCRELEDRGSEQSTKVVAAIDHYPGRSELSEKFNKFQEKQTLLLATMKEIVAAKRAAPATAEAASAKDIAMQMDRRFTEMNEAYNVTISSMKRQIEAIEHENENFM